MSRRKSKPQHAKTAAVSEERRSVRHPLYGQIPLLRHSSVGSDGKVYEWWQHDPQYAPPLPRGAVRGDVTRQVYCPLCHTPKYFYVDETRRCVQCGESFTFSGQEQKYWYEVRKFNFSSIPIRCAKCRRLRRSEHALREQIADARRAVDQSPDDPAAYLALARSLVEYHERTGSGRLTDAVAAARKARALWPEAPDAELWEGIAQARSGQTRQARASLLRFLEISHGRFPALESRARGYLAGDADA